MKVLFITYTGLTENLGRSQIVPYIKSLAQRGVRFSVVSFEPSRIEFEKIQSEFAGLGVDLHLFERPRGSVLRRALGTIRLLLKVIALVRTVRYDLIHCRNFVAAEYAMICRTVAGTPYLFDMRGFWGDARVETGLWDSRLLYSIWKSREVRYVRRAAAVNVLSSPARDWVTQVAGKPNQCVSVIPCCVEFKYTDEFVATHRARLRRELEIPEDALVVVYAGSLGGIYDDSRLLAVFAAIDAARSGARLILLGKHVRANVIDLAEGLGIRMGESQLICREVEHERVFEYYACGDVGTTFMKPGFYISGVSSTKVNEYLSVGLPFIGNAGIGDLARIATATDAGLALPDDPAASDTQAIAEFLDRMATMDRAVIRERARALFDLPVAVDGYAEIYERVSGRTK